MRVRPLAFFSPQTFDNLISVGLCLGWACPTRFSCADPENFLKGGGGGGGGGPNSQKGSNGKFEHGKN